MKTYKVKISRELEVLGKDEKDAVEMAWGMVERWIEEFGLRPVFGIKIKEKP